VARGQAKATTGRQGKSAKSYERCANVITKMPANKSLSNVKMARKRTRERPSVNILNPRRSDPDVIKSKT